MAEEVKPDQVAAEVAPMNVENSDPVPAVWEGPGDFEPRNSKTRPAYMLTVNLIESYKHINKVRSFLWSRDCIVGHILTCILHILLFVIM